MAENPEPRVPLEMLRAVMSPEFQHADRERIANTLKGQFMKDPELLAAFERLLGSHERGLADVAPTAEELRSFGWSDEDVVASSASRVAGAAATWAAAAAQSVK